MKKTVLKKKALLRETPGMQRYALKCKSCNTTLGMVTVFGEVYACTLYGAPKSVEYFTILVPYCAACTSPQKQDACTVSLFENLREQFPDIEDCVKQLREYYAEHSGYQSAPGPAPSFDQMREQGLFSDKKPKKKSFCIRL